MAISSDRFHLDTIAQTENNKKFSQSIISRAWNKYKIKTHAKIFLIMLRQYVDEGMRRHRGCKCIKDQKLERKKQTGLLNINAISQTLTLFFKDGYHSLLHINTTNCSYSTIHNFRLSEAIFFLFLGKSIFL